MRMIMPRILVRNSPCRPERVGKIILAVERKHDLGRTFSGAGRIRTASITDTGQGLFFLDPDGGPPLNVLANTVCNADRSPTQAVFGVRDPVSACRSTAETLHKIDTMPIRGTCSRTPSGAQIRTRLSLFVTFVPAAKPSFSSSSAPGTRTPGLPLDTIISTEISVKTGSLLFRAEVNSDDFRQNPERAKCVSHVNSADFHENKKYSDRPSCGYAASWNNANGPNSYSFVARIFFPVHNYRHS